MVNWQALKAAFAGLRDDATSDERRQRIAIVRQFVGVDAETLAQIMRDVEACQSSFERCRCIATYRTRTHYQREAALIDAHSDGGLLPARGEAGRAVNADERKQPTWWHQLSLWEHSAPYRSEVEFEVLVTVERTLRIKARGAALQRMAHDVEAERVALRDLHAKRGVQLAFIDDLGAVEVAA